MMCCKKNDWENRNDRGCGKEKNEGGCHERKSSGCSGDNHCQCYQKGFERGYECGYEAGYEAGYECGYERGCRDCSPCGNGCR
jgi:flagellar biosynthesis/type III secretory pathway protein FliH